jgi:hypothetical protein
MERIICLGSRYPESVRFRGTGAGRSRIPYLALHPMGFSVPRRLRFARWSLTPPFHPCRRLLRNIGGLIFCGTVRRKAFQPSARVYPNRTDLGYAASRPLVFGLSSSGCVHPRSIATEDGPKAILRPSKTSLNIIKKNGFTSRDLCKTSRERRHLAGELSFLKRFAGCKPALPARHQVLQRFQAAKSEHPCNAKQSD